MSPGISTTSWPCRRNRRTRRHVLLFPKAGKSTTKPSANSAFGFFLHRREYPRFHHHVYGRGLRHAEALLRLRAVPRVEGEANGNLQATLYCSGRLSCYLVDTRARRRREGPAVNPWDSKSSNGLTPLRLLPIGNFAEPVTAFRGLGPVRIQEGLTRLSRRNQKVAPAFYRRKQFLPFPKGGQERF